jgi:hypothetical protein
VDEEGEGGEEEGGCCGRENSSKWRVRAILRSSLVCSACARLVRGAAGELVLEVFGAEDGHFDEAQLALDRARLGVVLDRPHRYLCDVSV